MSDGEIPGADGPDEQFEALLREHLASRLDGQLGRAAAHFQRHLSGGTGGSFGAGPRTGSLRRSWGGWVVGIVGGAMAASIAALWAGPALWPAADRPDVPRMQAHVTPVAHDFDYDLDEVTLSRRTRDGGVVVLDDHTAVRRIVRQEFRRTRWVDEGRGVSVEKFEPRQEVRLIKMETY